MIIKEKITVKWTPMNRKHYESLGYKYTKKNDELIIWNTELCNSSDVFVRVNCDYCGKEYNLQYKKYYSRVLNNSQGINKCACEDCKIKKLEECNMVRYNGIKSYIQTQEGRNIVGDNKRIHNIEEVRKMFLNEGYILLTTEYKNYKQKLKYLCPKHGEQEIDLNHFKDGNRRCKACFYERNTGENNNKWNGGITELNQHLRQLLNEWKQESFKRFNYKCCISEQTNNLKIHHAYPFKDIVTRVLNELNLEIKSSVNDYSKEELNKIEKLFLEIHMNNLGYPMTEKLHKEFHSIYGARNCTEDDFKEFMKNKQKEFKIAQ